MELLLRATDGGADAEARTAAMGCCGLGVRGIVLRGTPRSRTGWRCCIIGVDGMRDCNPTGVDGTVRSKPASI